MVSLFERDTSTIGAVVGVLVMAIAVFGSTVLGWEWGASGQPIAFAVVAVVIVGWLSLREFRGR